MNRIPEGFKVSPTVFNSRIPGGVKRSISVLDSLPFKELLTSEQLASKIGTVVLCDSAHPALADYRFILSSRRVLFGSKKTIAELKRINSEKE